MSRVLPAVLLGVFALAASACGGQSAARGATVTPAAVVRHDLAPIAREFRGWHARTVQPDESRIPCPDLRGGTPTAGIATYFSYPLPKADLRSLRVTVAVEYRAPSKSRRFTASFGNPYTLQCERASELTYWRNVKPRPKPPFPRVRVTAGLPRSLAAERGRRARGYEVRILAAPGHVPRIYDLRFVYQDASDPHVVYHVIVSDTYLHLAAAASAGQLMARRVIRATS